VAIGASNLRNRSRGVALPWQRHRSSARTWVKVVLGLFVLPTLVGGLVLLVGGRPIAFEVLQRRTARRFPEVEWLRGDDLAAWQADGSRPQPVLLDARTDIEYRVSRLRDALQIDPYRPSLRPLRGIAKDLPVVVYSSAGYRGARVASWLGRMGYTRVQNLAGGIFAWVNDGRPVFRGDTPTAQVHPYDQRWGWLVEGDYRGQAPGLEKHSAAP
jgi:rhodanese-related sulfurtransferase